MYKPIPLKEEEEARLDKMYELHNTQRSESELDPITRSAFIAKLVMEGVSRAERRDKEDRVVVANCHCCGEEIFDGDDMFVFWAGEEYSCASCKPSEEDLEKMLLDNACNDVFNHIHARSWPNEVKVKYEDLSSVRIDAKTIEVTYSGTLLLGIANVAMEHEHETLTRLDRLDDAGRPVFVHTTLNQN